MEKEFWFNTGVRYMYGAPLVGEFQHWKDGTKQIQFYCEDVPENAIFKYASPYPDLEKNNPRVIQRKITRGGLHSKWAYFLIP